MNGKTAWVYLLAALMLAGLGGWTILACDSGSDEEQVRSWNSEEGDDDAQGDDDATDDDDAGGDDDDDDDDSGADLEWVQIQAGSFTMGSDPATEGDFGRSDNEAQHEVTLTHDFEILAHEVSFAIWNDYMPYNNGEILGCRADICPQAYVTFWETLAFANVLSEYYGLEPCYVLDDLDCYYGVQEEPNEYCMQNQGIKFATMALNNVDTPYECEGYRLPMEAEWEYAARAGATTAFYNGEITVFDTLCTEIDPALDAIAWYRCNAVGTQAIKTKPANDWGLYDMLGNVGEWTFDEPGGPVTEAVTDPVNEPVQEDGWRIYRGGSTGEDAHQCRLAWRSQFRSIQYGDAENNRGPKLGFRLVRTTDL